MEKTTQRAGHCSDYSTHKMNEPINNQLSPDHKNCCQNTVQPSTVQVTQNLPTSPLINGITATVYVSQFYATKQVLKTLRAKLPNHPMIYSDFHHLLQSGMPCVFGGLCMYVCAYVYVCIYVCLWYDSFRKSWPRKFTFGLQVHLEGIRVKLVYEGHPVTSTQCVGHRSV